MDEVEGWWITANVRRVPMSACRVEDRFFNLCGELCIMENEMKIHSQLDETKLKLDSSSLYNEVDPTGPRPAPSVSSRSLSFRRTGSFTFFCDNQQSCPPCLPSCREREIGKWLFRALPSTNNSALRTHDPWRRGHA